ncbi:MAG: hypothetical protein ACREQM_05830 [Candidatus Dormibacteraceae bacterium]
MLPPDVAELLRPGYLLVVLLILVVSQLCYALLPYRRRRYLLVLLLSAVGMLLGEIWALLGLPALQLGDANLVPGIPLALLFQLLQDRLWPGRAAERARPRQ